MELKEKAQPMEQSKFDVITEAIAKWIAMNGKPTNIVTDEGLQDVIRIASSNRSYELPSRLVIDSRLDDLFNSEKDSYLGVTGHTIDHSWSLHSFALAVYHVEDRHYSTPQRTLYLNKTDVVVKMTCIGKMGWCDKNALTTIKNINRSAALFKTHHFMLYRMESL